MQERYKEHFFFRGDANEQIGSGHLIRCRILARELKKLNHSSAFIIKNTDRKFQLELDDEGFHVFSLSEEDDETLQILQIIGSSQQKKKMLVIDSDEELLHEEKFQLRCIDHHISLMHIILTNGHPYYSDIIHNQNPLALEKNFCVQPYTRTLAGLEYVILDPSFTKQPSQSKLQNTIFISFGGSDQPNRTLALLKTLNSLDINIQKVIIVLGLMYPFKDELEGFLKEFKYQYELHQNTKEMSRLMRQSSIGITSGGFTIWELGVYKIKTAIVSYTEREQITANHLHEKKLSYHIGNIRDLSFEQLKKQLSFLFRDKVLDQNAERLYNALDPEGRIKVANEMIKIVDSI